MSGEVELNRATPRFPALVRRRGLFVLLLVLYLIVLAGLIAMSVAQHHASHS